MSFKPFEEILDLTLRLPIRGKAYTIYPISADAGLRLAKLNAAAIAKNAGIDLDADVLEQLLIDDDGMPDFARLNLGATLDEMTADGLSHAEIELATGTAFLFHTIDREAAELFWNSAGKAPAPSPSKSGRRPTATPTSTAAASTRTASPTGTSTRRKAKAAANRAARSAGSSPTTTT